MGCRSDGLIGPGDIILQPIAKPIINHFVLEKVFRGICINCVIALRGRKIGMNIRLNVLRIEAAIGSFRAEILCLMTRTTTGQEKGNPHPRH
jgi:hypothetical protein